MELPNSAPMGGDLDGMADFNAPEPPMGADPMSDPGMDMNQGGDMGPEPPMDNEPDMDGGPDDMGGGSKEDNELMSVLDKMSVEDKAAVLKYAKSMVDDEDDDFEMGDQDDDMGNQDDGMMPESRRTFRNIIDETINSVIEKGSNNGINRKSKKMPKRFRNLDDNPYKSQY